MARETSKRKDKLELDEVTDDDGIYTPVELSASNKFRLRFPPGSIYDESRTDNMHLTITLKIEGV